MYWASQVALVVKNWPTVQEIRVQSLSWEEPLEWAMTTHSSIVSWKIPWTEEPAGPQFMWSQSQTLLNLHKHNAYMHWPFLGPSFLLGDLDFPLALFIFWLKNFLNVSCSEVYCWGILWLLNIWKSLLHISFGRYFWGVLKSRCTIFFWIL